MMLSRAGGTATRAVAAFLVILFWSAAAPLPAQSPRSPAAGPLRVHPKNPRYFTDGSGKAIYLTGSHTWNTPQAWELELAPACDFDALLKFAETHNHNFLRLWAADSAWNSADGNAIEPQPFERTGPGKARDGKPRFDVTRWNQAYGDRLRQVVIACRDRGIYVGLMLFNHWGVGGYGKYSVAAWAGNPFHADNNINGINGDPNGDGKGWECHSLEIPAVTAAQENHVRKVIDSVNDLDNVLYEICNEGNPASADWQYHLIDIIRKHEASRPKQHPIGMTGLYEEGKTANPKLLKSAADWISPGGVPWDPTDSYSVGPPAADGRKVSVLDSDHTWNNAAGDWAPGGWADGRWVWRNFLRGHHSIYMDPIDLHQPNGVASGHAHKAGAILSARPAMGQTLAYANRIDLAAMTPREDLASTGYCLAHPGSEYLVYQPGSGPFTVKLPAGNYRHEWFRPASGSVASRGLITAAGGGDKPFSPPFDGDAVLYLDARAAGAPIALGPGPHLFLDDALIETQEGLERKVNRPDRRSEPVVTGPEDKCFQPYVTVIRDPRTGRFRIWYGIPESENQSHVATMESGDGIRWIRPHRVLDDPGHIDFGVSIIDEGPDWPDRDRRYKYGWWHGGLCIAASSDGLSWKPIAPGVILPHDHDINSIHRDPLRKRYIAMVSTYTTGETWSGRRRVSMTSVSDDLLHWRKPWLVFTPDAKDEGETQFYCMSGILARGDVLVGLLKVLRDDLPADPGGPVAGIGYTVLAWSRDGERWERDREPFLPRNPAAGTWDHAMTWGDCQILVGDETFIYYGGYARGHKVERFRERQIGLARMPRDRYVAREGGAGGGRLLTKLVTLEAGELRVNASVNGELRVRIVDEARRPFAGFDWDDAAPLRGDSIALPVRWKGDLASVRGKPVRLEIQLRDARLYALELEDASR